MNEHLMITKVEKGDVPKGEPVAAPPVEEKTVCDPRVILMSVKVEWGDVAEGDWIAASFWTRPRRVEHVDVTENGQLLIMAECDPDRRDERGFRRVGRMDWDRRGTWRKFPALRSLWEAAHSG